MLGPVRISTCGPSAASVVSFGTKGSWASASTTGWRPPRIARRGAAVGDGGERDQHVERRERVGGARERRLVGGHLLEQLGEERALEDPQPLLGPEHLGLVVLERPGDEALGADQRLLALVVRRDGSQVRPRHL